MHRLDREEYLFGILRFPEHPKLHQGIAVLLGCLIMIFDSWSSFPGTTEKPIEFNLLYVWPFVLFAIILDHKIFFRCCCENLRELAAKDGKTYGDEQLETAADEVMSTITMSRIISGLFIIGYAYITMMLSINFSLWLFKNYF